MIALGWANIGAAVAPDAALACACGNHLDQGGQLTADSIFVATATTILL